MNTVTHRGLKMVALPAAPKTTSPVPSLTSIYSTPERGHWGDARYPGNCSGNIIRDLLLFYRSKRVFDPMTGSGTCKDVCRDLGIQCFSSDVKRGFDAGDPKCYESIEVTFDFIWLHPPYWKMKIYSDDPRCLSNAKTVVDFYAGLQRVIVNCMSVLDDDGLLVVLMGDYFDPATRRMVPCTHMTRDICLRLGLWPAATDIIRFQHGNSSSKKSYSTSFIPGLHDTVMIFRR